MYRVSKLHTDGILEGITTTEVTPVPFQVGEIIPPSYWTGGGYTVTAVEEVAA